jgi:hypothetical protein
VPALEGYQDGLQARYVVRNANPDRGVPEAKDDPAISRGVREPSNGGNVIAKVIVWQNGMVMVFDEVGRQMPDYQGPKEEVWEKIKRDAPEAATFEGGAWETGEMKPISRID